MKHILEERTLRLLRGAEGLRRYAYDDATGEQVHAPKGNLTIGVGVNLDVGLDEYEIDMLERHRLHVGMTIFEHEVSTLVFESSSIVFDLLPDGAQVALAMMVFQLGPEGVMEFHQMLRAISGGYWLNAAQEALNSKWTKETPKRAHQVAALLRSCRETDHSEDKPAAG